MALGIGTEALFRGAKLASLACAALVGSAQGCHVPKGAPTAADVTVVPGVVVRKMEVDGSSVRVVDVALAQPGIRVGIAAEDVARRGGLITGVSRTVPEWLTATGAVAGINGGYFGQKPDLKHKEIVGLLKQDGRVRAAAPIYHSTKTGRDYSRSALGFTERGVPQLAWVTSRVGNVQELRAHAAPELSGAGTPWAVRQALACGPRLIRDGKIEVSFKGERLASPGALPRTFLGFGGATGKRHLLLCAADAMEFEECARFLQGYFERAYGAPCTDAMCMDGGSSTQAAWRENGAVTADPDPSTTVPTAILVYKQ